METGLEGKPWWHGVVVALVLIALGYYVANRFWFTPLERQISNQNNRITELDSQIRQGEAAEAQEEQFQARVERLTGELDKLLDILPERRNVHEIMDQVRRLAQQEDFTIVRFQPRAEVEKEYFNEWPIAINLEGTYHNLARFFDRLSRYERIFNIDTLRIDAINSPSPTRSIRANFVGKTFIYNETEEAIPAGASQ